MSKTKNYEKIKTRIEELAAAEKAKKISPDETVELYEKREELRRHEAAEELKNVKAAMAQAKRDALARILIANGIETENAVKEIMRFVANVKPELIPGKEDPENKPESETGDRAKEKSDCQPDTSSPKVDEKSSTPDAGDCADAKADSKPDDSPPEAEETKENSAPKCEICGAKLIKKKSKDGHIFLGCPNWKRGEKHTTLDVV